MRHYGQLSTKGQVVIPSELREQYGMTPGTRVAIEANGDHLILRPITDAYIESLRGCLKGGPSLADMRDKEHKDDRE